MRYALGVRWTHYRWEIHACAVTITPTRLLARAGRLTAYDTRIFRKVSEYATRRATRQLARRLCVHTFTNRDRV
jgi:hypothetical protein